MTGPRTVWRRVRETGGPGPRVTDIGVVLLVQAAVSVPWVLPRDPRLEPATLSAYLLTTLTVLPLLWRRRAPVRVLLAVMAAQSLYGLATDGPGQTLPYTGLVALYSVAAYAPAPARRLCGALTLAIVFPSVATAKEREFPAGTRQHYVNINSTVAGLLIEKVTGHSYEGEVSRRILAPLGLRDTSFPGSDPRIHGPHNHGYQRMKQADGTTALRDVSVWSATDGWAAGDIISTTADLERFLTALFRGRVVRGPLLEEMFTLPDPSVRDFVTGRAPAFSAGLSTWTLGGRQVWGKTGGRWGYNSGIGATRDLSRTLVYSINSTDAKAEGENALVMGVVSTVFGAPSAD